MDDDPGGRRALSRAGRYSLLSAPTTREDQPISKLVNVARRQADVWTITVMEAYLRPQPA